MNSLRVSALHLLVTAACMLAPPAHAEEATAVAGSYCLQGVHEVGSCIRLSPDGKFEYFLAYGAYDETAEGTWRVADGAVIATTPAYDKRPTFSFKRMQASEAGAYDVIVEAQNGQPIAGVDVGVTCDGVTKSAGVTQAGGFAVDCKSAPSAISLGLGMFSIAPQSIDVAAPADNNKAYVFGLTAGDLGKKRFADVPLRVDGDALEMTYTDTPITELQGLSFRYVRER
ncbi:hypothetical protein GIW81_02210 [Hyphomicrobium sp. xq]|uniref:Uncharacterized protein n=1 Tax=Hyphomicrobium album TaxID=2665159 RepID=A0A6I3KE53_9HYPH|nr:hypothetical protein [Hyphomicrobium album]MTD93144.1 hypothetical protein [Hyphomicrobium album]